MHDTFYIALGGLGINLIVLVVGIILNRAGIAGVRQVMLLIRHDLMQVQGETWQE